MCATTISHNYMRKAIIYSSVLLCAIYSGTQKYPLLILIADHVALYFVSALKWLSIPLIAISLLSTTRYLANSKEFIQLGGKVFKYTLITTLIAAITALGYFLLINPSNPELAQNAAEYHFVQNSKPIYGYLLFSALALSIALSLWTLHLDIFKRTAIQIAVAMVDKGLKKIINLVLRFMPLAIWAFITLFINEFERETFLSIGLYILCILAANLTQALIVLPVLLFIKKVPIIATFKGMLPAISVAFWTKSSSVALPVAIECAQKNLKLPIKVANFSLPLCIAINMNACAAFILTTVLFVTVSHGANYTMLEYAMWVGAATLAAIGNAGVPMGCYTLSCVILSMLGVPLYLLGLILPCYAMIDMLESAINVWSDSCVTAMVAQEAVTY
jgi:Na+/H+-dicarboxylate symporter